MIPATEFRYERKFVLEHFSRQEAALYLKLHPALFSEIYHARWVNSLYFDTENYRSFHQNIHESPERVKIRMRWYDSIFGHVHPFLEFKYKKNLLVGKEIFPLPAFTFTAATTIAGILDLIAQSGLPETILLQCVEMQPVLLNSYRRSYYLSADRVHRVTLDSDVTGYSMHAHDNTFTGKYTDNQTIIAELKYQQTGAKKKTVPISDLFPGRVVKHSKYVAGMLQVYGA